MLLCYIVVLLADRQSIDFLAVDIHSPSLSFSVGASKRKAFGASSEL